MAWKNARILITGGLGFVGSNLARKLAALGSEVCLLDNMLPGHGGNLFNLENLDRSRISVNFGDIRSIHVLNHLVQEKDVIFHLAGQVNHVASMNDPIDDLQINTQGTLTLLEACRKLNRSARIVFSGTRGTYGRSRTLPVSEEHLARPMGVYAVSNAAAEHFLQVYYQAYGIQSACLRISNTFGPRHQMRHNQYGVANWFIRQAMDGNAITIMGDGSIQRDYLYIDDLVEALMAAADSSQAAGEIINIGRGVPTTFLELAKSVVENVGKGDIKHIPFSDERLALEPGHYVAEVSKAKSILGWKASTPIDLGIAHTAKFYNSFKHHYWA